MRVNRSVEWVVELGENGRQVGSGSGSKANRPSRRACCVLAVLLSLLFSVASVRKGEIWLVGGEDGAVAGATTSGGTKLWPRLAD